MRMFRAALICVASVLLAACGGGGGGSGGGGPKGGGGPSGNLSVSTSTLTFTANGPTGPTPASQTVIGSVSGFSGSTLYISIVGTGSAISAISPVTLVNDTTGRATVSVPSPSSLGVGTYTGTITVRACSSDSNCSSGNLTGSPHTIDVTYYVAALQSTAASFDYTITNTPAASDVSKQATITGIPAQSWTASSDANWLSVTPSGGNGAALSASLVTSAVDALNNGTYTASITLQPGTAGQPLTLPVTLTIKRTQVSYVSPYVAYTGTSDDVIIRGEEFSQVTVNNVLFGSTPAQSFSIVSPTELRARYPSTLTPGRYTVGLQTASGFTGVKKLADLVVVNPPSFSAVALSYPDAVSQPNALIYDAERATLGVAVARQSGDTAFVAFPSNGTVWQSPISNSIFNIYGLALSADGKEWVGGNNKDVVNLDANTYATLATTRIPLDPSGTQDLANFAVANDGTIAMYGDVFYSCGAHLMLYDARNRRFGAITHIQCRGTLGASGDGARLLSAEQFLEAPGSTDDILSIDASTGALAPTGVHLLSAVAPVLDRKGSRIVLNNTRVYDGSYSYLGNLPSTTDAVVLAPDGSRAYAFDHSGKMVVYDLNGTLTGGVYPQIGSPITLAGNPGPSPTLPPALYTNAVVLMAITPDGKTVFIAGKEHIIVQPTPP